MIQWHLHLKVVLREWGKVVAFIGRKLMYTETGRVVFLNVV